MIKTESEYREAQSRLEAEKKRIADLRDRLVEQGLKDEDIKRLVDPLLSFHVQLDEEVKGYERIKRGDFGTIHNLKEVGRMLIGLRIFAGLSQKKLSTLLNVDESQISRDERNEYRSITLDRASRILEILDAEIAMEVTPPAREAPQEHLAPV